MRTAEPGEWDGVGGAGHDSRGRNGTGDPRIEDRAECNGLRDGGTQLWFCVTQQGGALRALGSASKVWGG